MSAGLCTFKFVSANLLDNYVVFWYKKLKEAVEFLERMQLGMTHIEWFDGL